MRHKNIIAMLAGSDRRSIGRANRVAKLVAANPRLFSTLMNALRSDDAVIRMRAADAAEKVTRAQPKVLRAHKKELLSLLASATQQELRWHIAAMIPRLELSRKEIQRAAAVFRTYLEDRSSIVKTFALHALSDLSQRDPRLQPQVQELLRSAAREGTPAMRARSRNLLRYLSRLT
jgi:hypothetical protein